MQVMTERVSRIEVRQRISNLGNRLLAIAITRSVPALPPC
jgi:hypothetical protein